MNMRILVLIIMALPLLGCGNEANLATVNGKSITEEEFTSFLSLKRIPAKSDKARNAMLDQYLEREALAAVIEKEKNYDIKKAKAELNEFRKEMLISRYFEQYLDSQVTDAAVKNYYAGHASDYENRKVRVAHILFRTNRNMQEAERKAQLTAAQEAYSKINKDGNFEEVAKNSSEDKISGKKGGDLGWLKEGAIAPSFSEKAFSLKVGEISEPFTTVFGYHIIKVLEAPVTVRKPFSAVQGDIRYQLRNLAKKAELDRLLSEVKIEKN